MRQVSFSILQQLKQTMAISTLSELQRWVILLFSSFPSLLKRWFTWLLFDDKDFFGKLESLGQTNVTVKSCSSVAKINKHWSRVFCPSFKKQLSHSIVDDFFLWSGCNCVWKDRENGRAARMSSNAESPCKFPTASHFMFFAISGMRIRACGFVFHVSIRHGGIWHCFGHTHC